MVKIRLTRMGRKKLPFYRIVAIKSEAKRDGKPISILGTYDPRSKEVKFKSSEEVKKFLKNGAQPTKTTEALLKKEGLLSSEGRVQ